MPSLLVAGGILGSSWSWRVGNFLVGSLLPLPLAFSTPKLRSQVTLNEGKKFICEQL